MAFEKIIICVKWGEKFGPEYVNKLYGMAKRNITGDFRLVCFTDNVEGLFPEVETRPLPELGCPHPERTIGKWRKVVLWGKELGGLSGPVLFVDLDSIIINNIDGYFTFGSPDDVILARNWAKPFSGMGQTSIFRFPIGKNCHILDDFRKNPQGIADKFRFEQHYITSSVTGGIKFWPGSWTRHFRIHCLPYFPFRFFYSAKKPSNAKVVTFPGGPNPSDVIVGRWDETFPSFQSRLQHIRNALQFPGSLSQKWRYLKRYVMRVTWIENYWQE